VNFGPEAKTGPRDEESILSQPYGTDKRRYLRYDILDYVVIDLDNSATSINAVIVDISLGGLQIRSRDQLPVGELCSVRVGCADLPPLALRGEIRHSTLMENSDLFSTGLKFMPEGHSDRMAIAEYVHDIFQRQCDGLLVRPEM